MGYDTQFTGEVKVFPPLNKDEESFLNDLSDSRRMDRVKGPLYVLGGSEGYSEKDVINSNGPDPTQPGLWCKWEPADEGHVIRWNEAEKFYDSEEWMRYLIDNLLSENGREYVEKYHSGDPRLNNFTFDHVCNGTIDAQGEIDDDKWMLIVKNNEVSRMDLPAF
jgi:hypothetical protein